MIVITFGTREPKYIASRKGLGARKRRAREVREARAGERQRQADLAAIRGWINRPLTETEKLIQSISPRNRPVF